MKTSLLPAGLTLVGEVEGRGDLVVAGIVEGPIELDGALTIEEGGEVRGDVDVTSLVVRGVLAGTATAKEAIRVEPSAIVVGDARAPRVNIIDGARFRGRVQMTGQAAAAPRRRRRAEEPRAAAEGVAPAERATERGKETGRAERKARRRGRGADAGERRREQERGPEAPEPGGGRPEAAHRGAPVSEPSGRGDRVRRSDGGERRREQEREPEAREPEAASAEAARDAARASEPSRRRGRRPPPPNIPAVQRQKARRKDRASGTKGA